MMIPTVHLNGTSATGLRQQYLEAYTAVQNAITALSQSAPHGRDYYVQKDPAAYTKAAGEHQDRMTRLLSVQDELLALYRAVDDQPDWSAQ